MDNTTPSNSQRAYLVPKDSAQRITAAVDVHDGDLLAVSENTGKLIHAKPGDNYYVALYGCKRGEQVIVDGPFKS